MLEAVVTRMQTEEKNVTLESHSFELSFEQGTEFDSAYGGDHAKIGRIFGHGGCRLEAMFRIKYAKNQFVDIDILVVTYGLRKEYFSCSGTTGDTRYLTHELVLKIDTVQWGENKVLITLSRKD